MIGINVVKKDNISKVTIQGHALYDDFGKDIVCASVSSICITTINACLRVNNDSILYKEEDGFLDIEVKKEDKITSILLENMVNLLEELRSNYPKNIKIIFN